MTDEQVRIVAERTFEARAESVREARRFVSDVVGDTTVDAAVAALLTSEIATNAVIHARTSYRVRVAEAPDGCVRVEIINDEPELLLAMTNPSEHGGRGLHIIDELADEWGAESRRDDKVVWFQLRPQER